MNWRDMQDEDEARLLRNRSKMGDYVSDPCPYCKRVRVMLGDDGKHRCEKCCWCVEDNDFDYEFLDYMK